MILHLHDSRNIKEQRKNKSPESARAVMSSEAKKIPKAAFHVATRAAAKD